MAGEFVDVGVENAETSQGGEAAAGAGEEAAPETPQQAAIFVMQ